MLKPLIAANWKMHGDITWAEKFSRFDDHSPKAARSGIDVLICPPFPFISPLSHAAKGLDIHIGAQASDPRGGGAHTGQVNAAMLKSAGASFIITGHSERRAAGETNQDVKSQAEAILQAGITPILCIGESLGVREAGQAADFVSKQLKACWPESISVGAEVVIAYEPIWAIGTGKVPSLDDISAMHETIRGIIGGDHRILYGGSVKPANAGDILPLENVNGALIGGASLEMESLAAIAGAAL
jgi:triosephosphate isomerase